jgi:transcriptional regulator with XRE-family HTH domain
MENGIKRIRLCMGLTQQQFADMLGCSQGNVGHYELRDQMHRGRACCYRQIRHD